jgi:predicted dehydrogenase
MNQSVHAIDILQWVAGPVKSVSAYAASRIHPEIEVEDTLSASLQFENGAFGTIVGTTAMYPGRPVRHEIGGSDGSAVVEGTLKFYKFRDERPEDAALLENLSRSESAGGGTSNTDVAVDLHARNITSIFNAWSENRDAETAGPEARKAVAIVLAMYESARKGGSAVAVST